jgi:ABC-type transporter Mla subunit MlaD
MNQNRFNAITAITCLLAGLVMVIALSYAIGKWSFGKTGYELTIKFPNATGIAPNSEVKYAGAPAGRVKAVRLIARKDQTQDPETKMFNCVDVIVEVNNNIELGNDVSATIKQDGFGISAKYVLLTPGPSHDSPLLADGATLQGEMPFDLSDLIQPAGEALEQTKQLVNSLQPVMNRLDTLTQKLQTNLPAFMDHADKFMQDGDGLLSSFNTTGSKAQLRDVLTSLQVSTENLKVVSTNAKALTATLAQKPWRVFWGGSTITPPSESAVMKSDKALPLKPDVDVNGPSSDPAPAKAKSGSDSIN